MTDLRKAAQQAVVMLKTGSPEYTGIDVLDVLEAALAAPQPEPVAWSPGRNYAERFRMAVTDEWVRGWDACHFAVQAEPPESELMTRAEFDVATSALESSLPLLKRMREDPKCARFDEWPLHLKADLYKRIGVEPVTMYRRLPPHPPSKKHTASGVTSD